MAASSGAWLGVAAVTVATVLGEVAEFVQEVINATKSKASKNFMQYDFKVKGTNLFSQVNGFAIAAKRVSGFISYQCNKPCHRACC
jgi:hypothetical protein